MFHDGFQCGLHLSYIDFLRVRGQDRIGVCLVSFLDLEFGCFDDLFGIA